MKKRAISSLLSGIAVVGLAGAVALGGALLPESQLSSAEFRLQPGSAQSAQGRMSLVCLGGVERTIQNGVSVESADEKISGASSAFIAGIEPEKARTQWEAFTLLSQNDHSGEQNDKQTNDESAQEAGKAASADHRAVSDTSELPGSAVTSSILTPSQEQHTNLDIPALIGAVSIARGTDGTPALIGGSAHTAQAGDLKGLAYNSCAWPTNAAWYVGSSTKVGNSNRLVVANPSLTNIQVNVRAFSSTGEVALGTSSVVLLPPKSVRAVALDGLIDEDDSVAFYLSSSAGQFVATIQSSALDGYMPAGVDFISAGRSGNDLVIPGLVLSAGELNLGGIEGATESEASALVDPKLKARVRLVNPGKENRKASVFLIDSEGAVKQLPGGDDVELLAGGVLDLSLDGVAPGDYSVRVTADGVVAAGAYASYGSDSDGSDIAWLAAQSAITDAGAYFGLGRGRLVVTPELAGNITRTAHIEWTAYDSQGKEIGKDTGAIRGTSGVDMPQGAAYVRLTSDVPVYAAVAGSLDQGISWAGLSENVSANSTTHINFEN